MKLTFEDRGNLREINVQSEETSDKYLNLLDPVNFPFVILTNENDDYIQCAGGKTSLTVEIRVHNNGSFKHFRVGSKNESKIWSKIECKVGPIMVLLHEDLELQNAIELFHLFYRKKDILESYNLRNITRQFT